MRPALRFISSFQLSFETDEPFHLSRTNRQIIDVEIAGVRAACERYAPGTAIPITVRPLLSARAFFKAVC